MLTHITTAAIGVDCTMNFWGIAVFFGVLYIGSQILLIIRLKEAYKLQQKIKRLEGKLKRIKQDG